MVAPYSFGAGLSGCAAPKAAAARMFFSDQSPDPTPEPQRPAEGSRETADNEEEIQETATVKCPPELSCRLLRSGGSCAVALAGITSGHESAVRKIRNSLARSCRRDSAPGGTPKLPASTFAGVYRSKPLIFVQESFGDRHRCAWHPSGGHGVGPKFVRRSIIVITSSSQAQQQQKLFVLNDVS
jgi:hypothetical protein